MLSADPMEPSFRSGAATVMATWATAVVVITTVGAAATTMVGGIIAIGGDYNLRPEAAVSVGGLLGFISKHFSGSP
jgi:hypothetical protein